MDTKVEAICRACHEANRVLCDFFGDDSQLSWNQAPQSSREATREGVRAILAGEVATPAALHQRWVDRKRAKGWRYGKTKSAVSKTHPLLVSFPQLDPQHQAKDALFLAIVKALS